MKSSNALPSGRDRWLDSSPRISPTQTEEKESAERIARESYHAAGEELYFVGSLKERRFGYRTESII